MSAPTLADPLYGRVIIENDPGYEYKGPDGRVYGPYPAVAIFTWVLKRMFPPTQLIRSAGRLGFRPLSDLASDIMIIARIQMTHVMLEKKEWFYLDAFGSVQGPFSAERMVTFIATRYMKESVKFYGRDITQAQMPPPLASSPDFRAYGDLLNEALIEYRNELKLWREQMFGHEYEASNGRDRTEAARSEGKLEDHSRIAVSPPVVRSQSPSLPLPPVSSEASLPQAPLPIPKLSFEALRDTYAVKMFSDDRKDWYLFNDDQQFYGPLAQMTRNYVRLAADSRIGSVPTGQPIADHGNFLTFQQCLENLHLGSLS